MSLLLLPLSLSSLSPLMKREMEDDLRILGPGHDGVLGNALEQLLAENPCNGRSQPIHALHTTSKINKAYKKSIIVSVIIIILGQDSFGSLYSF